MNQNVYMEYQRPGQGNQGQIQQQSKRTMDYTVDMVFCIDSTGSMESFSGTKEKIINMVKRNAVNLYTDFTNVMNAKGKKVRQLRIRVISFRDYIADEEKAMMVTDFFHLPTQSKEFENCINGITAEGGGDAPEDGLEALAYAIKSDWTAEGMKKRQVIVVWTDQDTHQMGYAKNSPWYPKGMPEDLDELNDWWDDVTLMKQNEKRLILFAPDVGNWKKISDSWSLVYHFPTTLDNGLAEQSYQEILNLIANSV